MYWHLPDYGLKAGAIPTAVGSDLHFAASLFSGDGGLWRLTSPTEAPQFIPTVGPDRINGGPGAFHMTAAGGALYFTGRSVTGGGYSLWKCEGATTTLIQDFPDNRYYPLQMVAVGLDIYFSDQSDAALSDGGVTSPTRVWKWSTTGAGSAELVASRQGTGVGGIGGLRL
jgi:hypothetical protein